MNRSSSTPRSTLGYYRRKPRRMLPISLLLLGLYLFVGCIPIPATRMFQGNGRRTPDAKIGTSKNAPVSIGRTRIEDALIVLVNQVGDSQVSGNGVTVSTTPSYRQIAWHMAADGRHFRVGYTVRTATIIWPLCFQVTTETQPRAIELVTDEHGIVTAAGVAPPGQRQAYPMLLTQLDVLDRAFSPDARRKLQEAGLLLPDEQLKAGAEAYEKSIRELARLRAERATSKPSTRP